MANRTLVESPTRGSDADRRVMRQWERFVTGRKTEVAQIGQFIASSWTRCAESGVDPHGRSAPLTTTGDGIQKLRWRHRELLHASAGLVSTIRDLLVGSRSVVIVTTSDGVVLDASGHPQTLALAREIHLMQGGDWREAVIGTNGIGTALATGAPTQIHATEHFCEGIKGWSCAAAPIREPGSQAVLGVIDISGTPDSFQCNNLALAVTAAQQIEALIGQNRTLERSRLLEVCLNRLSANDAAGLAALDRHGHLVHVSGQVPAELRLGRPLPEWDDGYTIEDWARRLPPGVRAEWLHPITANGQTIGAMLIVPRRHRQPALVVAAGTAGGMVEARSPDAFDALLGESAAMAATLRRARQLASRRVAVLIEGETGVGKELVARGIHHAEGREQPFIAFNCGAATRELIASELFGHVRGAFTGATNDGRPGRFELANGGTLCLDEIGELPLDLQPVLLRALEEGVIYRLGDAQPRRVDVRVIALTNRSLADDVASGRFRRDLYHRIGVTRLNIPALRERASDIDLLVAHFNRTLAERHGVPARHFGAEVMACLRRHAWPGNVRELRNLVESLLLTGDSPEVTAAELSLEATSPANMQAVPDSADTLDASEQQAIERGLSMCRNNLAHTARMLGISRSTLYRKIARYGLQVQGATSSRQQRPRG